MASEEEKFRPFCFHILSVVVFLFSKYDGGWIGECCVPLREKDRERERVCVRERDCVCVRERGRGRETVCVCVCERERER